MWKQIKTSQYFFLMIKDGGYELFITDYMSIWTIKLSADTFLYQMKNCNEGLELEADADFVYKGLYLLENVDTLKRFKLEVDKSNQSVTFTMGVSFGYPFYFACRLFKGSNNLFFKMVTQPLLKTVCDLRASQLELRYLLKKKDTEIAEYKYEGGEIVLRHLKTVPYNDEEHMKKHNTYEENYGYINLPSTLIEKVVEVPPQKALEMEHITLDSDPESESSDETEPNLDTEYEQNAETESEQTIKMETEPNVKTEPIPNIETEPAHDMDTKSLLNIDTKSPLDIDTKPALDIDTKPALDIDTKPPLDIDTKPALESMIIKTEDNPEVSGEPSTSVVTPSVSCKKDVKSETKSTQGNGIPRKRSKFNF